MNVLLIIIPITLLLAGTFLFIFIWATKNGQFDDLVTPSHEIFVDDLDEINEDLKKQEKITEKIDGE